MLKMQCLAPCARDAASKGERDLQEAKYKRSSYLEQSGVVRLEIYGYAGVPPVE